MSLTHADYRVATWVCVFLGFAQQMAGINIINVFTSTIFDKIAEKGAISPLSSKTESYFIGASGFFGAFLGIFTVRIFTRRFLFIFNHFTMMICLVSIGVCIDQE